MTDATLIGQIASLGLGAVIAVIVLMWKRGDDLRHDRYMMEMNSRLTLLIENDVTALNNLLRAIEKIDDRLVVLERLRRD